MRSFEKWLPSLLVVAVLLISMFGGAAYAKYVMDTELKGNVTITANLGTITLKEHMAEKQSDGSYVLDMNTEVTSNTYDIIPGLDIPKDPFITITDKSPIEVYVFVEVVSTLTGSALDYEVDTSNWTQLDVPGAHDGIVYVYKEVVKNDIGPIYILNNNEVTVSQKLNSMNKTDLGLTFYASMYQVDSGTKGADNYAASVYSNNNP